jgi:D-glycero-D-manno-heptose 1,7-bisphosphate phosphatase
MKETKKKAVFLDRDGVINTERGFTYRLQDFQMLPDLIPALKEFLNRGYILIVVSNQSGVAKELYKQEDIELLHKHMCDVLVREGINFHEIYYCIHHPDVTNCICRKPDSVFIEKALSRFNIDPSLSYFIGDKLRDVEAAVKAGVNPVLIEANSSLLEVLNIIP